jgi:hypothetical protein
MPIVAGGGFYTQPFYPREIGTMSEEQVYQALVEQAEADPIGAFGTRVLPNPDNSCAYDTRTFSHLISPARRNILAPAGKIILE